MPRSSEKRWGGATPGAIRNRGRSFFITVVDECVWTPRPLEGSALFPGGTSRTEPRKEDNTLGRDRGRRHQEPRRAVCSNQRLRACSSAEFRGPHQGRGERRGGDTPGAITVLEVSPLLASASASGRRVGPKACVLQWNFKKNTETNEKHVGGSRARRHREPWLGGRRRRVLRTACVLRRNFKNRAKETVVLLGGFTPDGEGEVSWARFCAVQRVRSRARYLRPDGHQEPRARFCAVQRR